MKKYFLFIVLTVLVNGNLFAATGCLRAGQVYTDPPSGWNQWTNPVPNSCPNGASASTEYAGVNSTGGSCTIGFWGLGGSGVLVNYDIEYCPIDDYIPLMLVVVGGAASYFLRRKFLYAY